MYKLGIFFLLAWHEPYRGYFSPDGERGEERDQGTVLSKTAIAQPALTLSTRARPSVPLGKQIEVGGICSVCSRGGAEFAIHAERERERGWERETSLLHSYSRDRHHGQIDSTLHF